jgi:hypothetical protein
MSQRLAKFLTFWVAAAGVFLVMLGLLSFPHASYADTGPPCNEGADPSLPDGCFGWCYSPKICEPHPIQLVCKCR